MKEMDSFRDWALAVGALGMAYAATVTVRASLRKMGTSRGWPLLTELAPAFASLIYVVGLRVFAEMAPLNPKLDAWLDSVIYVVAVLIVLRIIRRAAMVGIEWSASRSRESASLQQGFIPLLRNLITLFIFFTGAIMILKRFNYDVMSLLTALGVGSLAVGLAAKETLSNMISGFTLIIDRNLRPGDRINLGGTLGDVQEIGLRSTLINTGDGNTLIVPNFELVNTKILNLSMPSRESTCSTTFGVPYTVAFARVRDICLEVLAQVARCNQSRGKWVTLDGVSAGFQAITVGFWLFDMDDKGAVLSDFHERLLARLERERIPLSAPPALTPLAQK
jgi:small-conductance mechanosensitive channel